MGMFEKIVEWSTECKYVSHLARCGACNKKIGFFSSGFWSKNSELRHLSNGVLCGRCYEHAVRLIEDKNKWMSKKLRKLDEWKKFDSDWMVKYSVEDIQRLFRQKEICDGEVLCNYGRGASGIFIIKNAFQIEPDIFAVGIKRAKKLYRKMVVFGTVEEGIFEKGNSVKINICGNITESTVVEAFAFEQDSVNGRAMSAVFDETLRANLRYTRKIKENKMGWLILDVGLLGVLEGDLVVKYNL